MRIDVAECVGGGDLAELEGIVNDGREEVDGLHGGDFGGEAIDGGVVGGFETDEAIWIVLDGKFFEERRRERWG